MAIAVILLLGLLPSSVMARGLVPEGVTLLGWSTTPNNGGQSTMINLKYSDGFSTAIQLDAPFNPSWHTLNDVRPILQAYKEGYGPDLGGEGGVLGTDINFAPNVLAAMKVQSFNPAQVGGANIPPESTTLNEEQIAWLQKGGYTVPAEFPASNPATEANNEQALDIPEPKSQAEPEPKQEPMEPMTEPKQVQVTETASSESPKLQKADPDDPVGETFQSPATAMTKEMIEENQKLVAENPPTINEPKIPVMNIGEQVSETKQTNSSFMIWIGAGLVVTAFATLALGKAYRKRNA